MEAGDGPDPRFPCLKLKQELAHARPHCRRGLVGLTAALALRRDGADVVVHERASEIRAVGAAIGLWRNALDVFAGVGVGDGVQVLGTTVHTWFYDAAGNRFRAPGPTGAEHTMLLLPRPELTRLLADAVTPGSIRLGST